MDEIKKLNLVDSLGTPAYRAKETGATLILLREECDLT